MVAHKIKINRAPVLTLWAVVVGERLGYKREEALTLAKGLTGLTGPQACHRLWTSKDPRARFCRAHSLNLEEVCPRGQG